MVQSKEMSQFPRAALERGADFYMTAQGLVVPGASWDSGEPNTCKWGVPWGLWAPRATWLLRWTFSAAGLHMGWRAQQKLCLPRTQSLWTDGQCREPSALKWLNCNPWVGPFLLKLSMSGRQCIFLHMHVLPYQLLETMSLITLTGERNYSEGKWTQTSHAIFWGNILKTGSDGNASAESYWGPHHKPAFLHGVPSSVMSFHLTKLCTEQPHFAGEETEPRGLPKVAELTRQPARLLSVLPLKHGLRTRHAPSTELRRVLKSCSCSQPQVTASLTEPARGWLKLNDLGDLKCSCHQFPICLRGRGVHTTVGALVSPNWEMGKVVIYLNS